MGEKKSRETFAREYAKRSRLSDDRAIFGLVDIGGGHLKIALPCACGDEQCDGWAMISDYAVIDHMETYAPEPLRSAYRQCVDDCGGALDSPSGEITAHEK